MNVLPINADHPTYAAAWVVMRAAAWPAKVCPGSTFGYPGDDCNSEYWRDDWGRRFVIEKDGNGLRDRWTVREVAL